MPLIDYKNINGDLSIEDGDFAKHDAHQQHIKEILITSKGSLRQFPLVGCNITDFINAPWSLKTQVALEKTIRLQLEADGYTIRKVNAKSLDNIEIDAFK